MGTPPIIQSEADLTLTQLMELAEKLMRSVSATLLVGSTFRQKRSENSFNIAVLLASLASWAAQATAEHYRLQCWTETNEYATTLTVARLLQNFTLGSVSAMALADLCVLTQIAQDRVWQALTPYMEEILDIDG